MKKLLVVFVLLIFGGALWLAEDPRRLDRDGEMETKKIDLAVIAPKAEEKPKEEAKPQEPEVAPPDSLAPESMTADASLVDNGFGAAYGSGGNGPGVATSGNGQTGSELVSQMTSVDRGARVVSRPPLEYPAEAKARGIKGHVTLKIKVEPTGVADTVSIAESEPPGFFDEVALRSVKDWRFEPAIVKGKATSAWLMQRIRFELD